GLAVFVHGGYWRRFDPSWFSHLAAGAVGRGWAVAMPGYTLCPEASITQISEEVSAAIAHGAGMVPGQLRLAGHSAGGHLVTRAICPGGLPEDVLTRVEGVLSISGLHDLRPLRLTAMNDELRLTAAEAEAESPALLAPTVKLAVMAWVGADELPEFRRQAALLANIWRGLGLRTTHHEVTGANHFTVIDPLSEPGSALTRAWLGEG
ncbi:MAG: alpha/beta hydrolase, partial [Pseudomonadota bacterium]